MNKASCFPEVGGDAAVYFDIDNRGEMAEVLEPILTGGEGKRADMAEKGCQQASKFSWEASATLLKGIYDSLI